jgi:hypothetical protein
MRWTARIPTHAHSKTDVMEKAIQRAKQAFNWFCTK